MPDPVAAVQATPQSESKASPAIDLTALADEYNFDGNVDEVVDTPAAPVKSAPAARPAAHAVTVGGQRPEAAKPAPPPTYQHPAYLTRRAEELGMSGDEIAGMPTTQLDRDVYTLSKQHIAHEREMARLEALNNATARRPEPAAATTAPVPDAEALDWGEEADALSGKKVKIAEESIHPGIVNQFKAMQRELKALKEQLGQVNQREQDRANRTMSQQCDDAFNGLDERLFGRGTVYDMDPTDLALMRRKMVTDSLKAKPPAKGSGSIKKLIGDRARELFGLSAAEDDDELLDLPTTPKPRARAATERERNPDGTFVAASLAERQAQWREGPVAKPTQRDSPGEKKGPRKAERAAAEFMREHGTLEPDDEVLNGFLS